jgi:hypothetical protein
MIHALSAVAAREAHGRPKLPALDSAGRKLRNLACHKAMVRQFAPA